MMENLSSRPGDCQGYPTETELTDNQMNIADAIAALLDRNEPVPKPLRLPTESDVRAVETVP